MGVFIATFRVARIGSRRSESANELDAKPYDSVDGFLAASPESDVILLEIPAQQAGEALRLLRGQSAYRYIPIYCCQEQDDLCKALSDGAAPVRNEQISTLVQAWEERYAKLDAGQLERSIDRRILAWLWLMAPRRVQAVRNTEGPDFYEYPLLEALAPDTARVQRHSALQRLVQQGLLARTELVDRVRLCVYCGSGRLNYVDACPQCHSFDIARQPSVRCASCGYTGELEGLFNATRLHCPACRSKLRHAANLHGRQAGTYRCHGCAAVFTEVAVHARCFDCGSSHDSNGLRVHEIHGYQLSEAGRLHCRLGLPAQGGHQEHLDIPGLLDAQTFHYSLDWLLDMHRRYGVPAFSLLGLRLNSAPRAGTAHDGRRAAILIDALLEHLVDVMREADRCARTSGDLLWLLLPNTDHLGLSKVRQRITDLIKRYGEGSCAIELRMAGVSAPLGIHNHENADLLMARLIDELLE